MPFSTGHTHKLHRHGGNALLSAVARKTKKKICSPQQFLRFNEPPQSMIWEFGSARNVQKRKKMFQNAFDNVRDLMHGHAEKSVLSHDQIIHRVLIAANDIQCDGYKVTSIYGSVSVPMKRKGSTKSHFENYINYTVVYRKYKPNETRAKLVRKITRTAPTVSLSRLENTCLRLTNNMERQGRNIISRVMLSDIASAEKILTDPDEYMMGRTRITIFYT